MTIGAAAFGKIVSREPDGFDLIITDQTMPHMTGDRLARSILEIRPGMPIIVCTGFSENLDESSAKALGIQGFVMKPAGALEMAEAIRAVLDARAPARPDF